MQVGVNQPGITIPRRGLVPISRAPEDPGQVGFGTGLNVPYYPDDVSAIHAVEPSTLCMRISEPRRAKSRVPIHYAGLTSETHELEEESADSVLSTWTCTASPT